MGRRQENNQMMLSNANLNILGVPKLAADGSNGVTFKTRFLYAMAGRDMEGHLDRSELPPTPPTPLGADPVRLTTVDKEKIEAYHVAHKKWKHDENVAQAQLAQVISDSLLI